MKSIKILFIQFSGFEKPLILCNAILVLDRLLNEANDKVFNRCHPSVPKPRQRRRGWEGRGT